MPRPGCGKPLPVRKGLFREGRFRIGAWPESKSQATGAPRIRAVKKHRDLTSRRLHDITLGNPTCLNAFKKKPNASKHCE